MFNNIWNVMRREMGAIFAQPIAYIFAFVMIGFTGFFYTARFTASVLFQGAVPADLGAVFDFLPFLTLLGLPALTMRLLAEEQRSGTIELLMTLPIRDGEVVVGKFLASFVAFLVPLALTLVYVVILYRFGNPDAGVLLTSYIGVLLWGAGILGIGMLTSALTENQMSAWMLAFGIVLLLYLADWPAQTGAFDEPYVTIFRELSYLGHIDNFQRGLITARDVLYYLLVTAVTLFGATRIMESRRWR